MQSSLSDKTRGNYHPKVVVYLHICLSAVPEPLCPCPASEDTIMHFLAALAQKGTIQAHCMRVHLSAVNKFHKEQGYPPPASGEAVTAYLKGLGRLQKAARDESGSLEHVRAPLPTYIVCEALDLAVSMSTHLTTLSVVQQELFRSLVFVCLNFVLICRGDTGVSLPAYRICLEVDHIVIMPLKEKGKETQIRDRMVRIPRAGLPELWQLLYDYKSWHAGLKWKAAKRTVTPSFWRLPHEMGGKWPASLADTWLQLVMNHLNHSPPKGLVWSGHSMRKGSASASRAIGCFLEAICYFANWSILAGTFHTYIDPTWTPTAHCWRLFGWMRKDLTPPVPPVPI